MFRFRLEKVLRHRERQTEEQGRALKQAVTALQKLRERRRQLEERLEQLAAHGLAERARRPDVAAWRRRTGYLSLLRRQRQDLLDAEREAVALVESERELLLERHRAQEVLERLKQRQRTQWEYEQARRERKQMDEMGAVRASRRAAR
jgi:flagellar export protein FliJ